MRLICREAVLTAAVCLVISVAAKAQLVSTYTFGGTSAGALWGESVNGAGDVNGDGYDDFIAGGSEDDNGGTNAGRARVYSGFDGSVIHTFLGSVPFAYLGFSVDGVGDVDADGYDDVVVSDFPPAGTVFGPGRALVISGQTGTIIATLVGDSNNDVFGYCVSGAGDVDADGTPDIIVGAPFDDNNGTSSGSARVFSGATMLPLYSIDGNNVSANLGISVSGAGDVNGDGFDDFIVGAPQENTINGFATGAARVYSGFDGSILHTFSGVTGLNRFGHCVSCAGDVDADGYDDVIVSAPGGFNPGIATGMATVYSGLTGSVIATFTGSAVGAGFGEDVNDCGDVNGDGVPDVVITEKGAFSTGMPKIFVYSGLGGAPLETITAGSLTGDFIRASGAGDLNRDGFKDIVVGRRQAGGSGRVNVFLATTLPVLNYRSKLGLSGLSLEWQPTNGNISDLSGTLVGSGSSPNAVALYGVSLAPAQLSVFGFPLLIAVDTALNLIETGMFTFDSMGTYTTPSISRKHPAIAGSLVHVQWFEISPVLASSNGIRLTMEP